VIDTERILATEPCESLKMIKPLCLDLVNDYISNTDTKDRHLQESIMELSIVRQSTGAFLRIFSHTTIRAFRTASNNNISSTSNRIYSYWTSKHHLKKEIFETLFIN
jgi:hypothetical protein